MISVLSFQSVLFAIALAVAIPYATIVFSSIFRGFLVVFPFGNCILPYLSAYSKRLNVQNIRRYFRCIFGGSDTG